MLIVHQLARILFDMDPLDPDAFTPRLARCLRQGFLSSRLMSTWPSPTIGWYSWLI